MISEREKYFSLFYTYIYIYTHIKHIYIYKITQLNLFDLVVMRQSVIIEEPGEFHVALYLIS